MVQDDIVDCPDYLSNLEHNMNKRTLSLTLGSALASSLMGAAPTIQAGENPFAMSSINPAQQLAAADDKSAEAGCSGKMPEAARITSPVEMKKPI